MVPFSRNGSRLAEPIIDILGPLYWPGLLLILAQDLIYWVLYGPVWDPIGHPGYTPAPYTMAADATSAVRSSARAGQEWPMGLTVEPFTRQGLALQ